MCKCLICGKKISIDKTCMIITEGKNKYKAVCCIHEGSQQLKELIAEKANTNMIFYEFINNSYYALVGIQQKIGNRYVKALRYYYENVCDEGFEDFLSFHGKSNVVAKEVTKEYAFNKFIIGCKDENVIVKKVIEDFEKSILEDEALILIDSSLV